LDVVRRHCRIDQIGEDDLLFGYLRTARTMAEMYLSRALITQTLLWTVTPEDPLRMRWHHQHGAMELPRAPVQSIVSVVVNDDRGNATVLPAATMPLVSPFTLLGYRADLAHHPARLYIGSSTVLTDGRTLRSVNLESVQIEYIAGYGSDATTIPQPILDAILLTTAFLYEHRGDAGGDMPRAAEWLLDPYRLMFF
jgi:uncharacterized phiE125 gp8 family phage protein